MLIGRSQELDYLTQYYNQADNSLIVLYGQKGLGVSALLQEFAKDRVCLRLKASQCSPRQQCYVWSGKIRNQGISIGEYPDFSALFKAISELYANQSNAGKAVLMIEDFQWAVRNSEDFMNALTAFLAEEENKGRLMMILASNAIGWVENTFISKIGRNAFAISGFLKVKPMSFLDMVCFYDTNNTKKCMEFYSIAGGNPGYWTHFDIKSDLKSNICRLFLNKDAVFASEGLTRISEELRELSVYGTILAALAEGREKLNDLYAHTGFSRAKISVYLKNLMALELVEKVFSYETADNRNSKKGVYRICDPLVQFWYHFIFPYSDELGVMGAEEFYDTYIAGEIADYISAGYGKICAEYLNILNERGKLPVQYTRHGEWVGKNGRIDVVGQDAKRNTLLGFCNISGQALDLDMVEANIALAKEAHLRPEHCFFFSADGFTQEVEAFAKKNDGVYLVDMNDL
ncbi:MAG: ATP-binding protein [Lachnospiraceae bacterium]|nr:ATP-binding protein [Lachnospiraceae bacterium]